MQYRYKIHSIRDYNTVIGLLKEHNLPLLKIDTVADEETFIITTEGERNVLKFIAYLAKKEQARVNDLLEQIKVEEFEIEKL